MNINISLFTPYRHNQSYKAYKPVQGEEGGSFLELKQGEEGETKWTYIYIYIYHSLGLQPWRGTYIELRNKEYLDIRPYCLHIKRLQYELRNVQVSATPMHVYHEQICDVLFEPGFMWYVN